MPWTQHADVADRLIAEQSAVAAADLLGAAPLITCRSAMSIDSKQAQIIAHPSVGSVALLRVRYLAIVKASRRDAECPALLLAIIVTV